MTLTICNIRRVFWGAKKPGKIYFAFLWHWQALDWLIDWFINCHQITQTQQIRTSSYTFVPKVTYKCFGLGGREQQHRIIQKPTQTTAFKQIFSKCNFTGKMFRVSQKYLITYRSEELGDRGDLCANSNSILVWMHYNSILKYKDALKKQPCLIQCMVCTMLSCWTGFQYLLFCTHCSEWDSIRF